MSIALVTTCLNERMNVITWINSVKAQLVQPDYISIVDAGSIDGSIEVLSEWAKKDKRVIIEVKPRCTVAQGRNLAIKNVPSEIIVSTDMGCRLNIEFIKSLVTPMLEDESIMVVAGNYKAYYTNAKSNAASAAFYCYGDCAAPLVHRFLPSSRSIAYRRTVWINLEGYPEDLTYAADDTVFAYQIYQEKYKIAFAPKAISYWKRHQEIKNYWREAYNYSKGNGEALVCGHSIFNSFPNGLPVIVRIIKSLYVVLKRSLKAIFKALLDGKFIAALYIPLLLFGCEYFGIIGYENGLKEGSIRCLKCRHRLIKHAL